jgi:sterol desaturase/sphingolipid hydroxylase (fatty acid hydroxylase superfamily)
MLQVSLAHWMTPGMHRIHHAQDRADSDANYGALVSCWDRLFGSFRSCPPENPHEGPLGLAGWNDPVDLGLPQLLVMPFRSKS